MDILEIFTRHKNKIVNILVIILAFYFAIKIYKSQIAKNDSLKSKIEVENQKNDVVEKIIELRKRNDSYVNFVNNKDISVIINNIGNIARMYSVQLVSVRPMPRTEDKIFETYPFSVALEADSYHKIGKFIAKIESHPDIYIVNRASVSAMGDDSSGMRLSCEIVLSTIMIRE